MTIFLGFSSAHLVCKRSQLLYILPKCSRLSATAVEIALRLTSFMKHAPMLALMIALAFAHSASISELTPSCSSSAGVSIGVACESTYWSDASSSASSAAGSAPLSLLSGRASGSLGRRPSAALYEARASSHRLTRKDSFPSFLSSSARSKRAYTIVSRKGPAAEFHDIPECLPEGLLDWDRMLCPPCATPSRPCCGLVIVLDVRPILWWLSCGLRVGSAAPGEGRRWDV